MSQLHQDRIRALLDAAHEALPADELAALLVGVRRITGPLGGLLRPVAPALSPAVRAAHMDPLLRELAAASGAADDLGAWLHDYLDDLAARPRGSALTAA